MSDSQAFASLVERARDPAVSLHNRHTAFAEIVRRTEHRVLGLAVALLGDADDARDAAQDAFMAAWQRLGQLRDPAALEPWLRSIVARACARQRRGRRETRYQFGLGEAAEQPELPSDYETLVASALRRLPNGERDVTVLFYFVGCTLPEIGRLLHLKPGTVGKRLHSARLRIRRDLPRSVRDEFVRLTPSRQLCNTASSGMFDECVGEYRFEGRPALTVTITREGNSLVGRGNGQRQVLLAGGRQSLWPAGFDGEGRFRRNRRGEVTHFVYYEFGKRLGVARKISG